MKSARFPLIVLLVLALISPATLAQDSRPISESAKKDLPQAKQLLEKAVEAMGGKDAFKQIKTSRTKMSIETPMGNVAIESSVGEKGMFHANIDQAGMVMTSGSNGKHAWMQNPMAGGYQLLPQEQADQMRQQTSVHDIVLQMMKQFDSSKTVDMTDFNDESCFQVHLSSEKTKEEQEAFFSVKSGRLVGTTSTQEGPMGEMEITMSFNEWKKFGDLTLFTEIAINQMGMEMVMKIDEIEFNKVDPAIFAMPDEVKDLIAEQEAAATSQPNTTADDDDEGDHDGDDDDDDDDDGDDDDDDDAPATRPAD